LQPKKKKSQGKKSTKTSGEDSKIKALDPSLPPLTNLPDIFKHLVGQANKKGGLDKVFEQLNGRGLRVGTMCS
jgi:hypothetical protein